MGFPKVKVNISEGNLLRSISAPDAGPAILVTGMTGDLVAVYSVDDATLKGVTGRALTLVAMFYKELAGNMRVFVAPATEANAELLASKGVNLMAWIDDATTEQGITQLSSTIKASAQKMQAAGFPMRVLAGGTFNAELLGELDCKTLDNPYLGIVVGEDSETGASIAAAALARCCKYGAEEKIGSGKNGALVSITDATIGGKAYTDFTLAELETMHDNGYIMPQHRTGTAGYFFGQDNMCSNGDFRILAHGRIIDKAQAIIQQAYAPFIETPIRVASDGTLDDGDVSYMENVLECSLLASMTGQVSGVQVVIDKNQDIINSSTLEVSCRIQPLGYATWINVTLGLATKIDS